MQEAETFVKIKYKNGEGITESGLIIIRKSKDCFLLERWIKREILFTNTIANRRKKAGIAFKKVKTYWLEFNVLT